MLRLLAVAAVCAAVAWGASFYSRGAALLALLALLVLALLVLVWLPRAAHGAFRTGRYGRAAAIYRVLGLVRLSRNTRASIRVSLAACALGTGDYDRALAILDRLRPNELSDAVRAAWLNNRAYALARGGSDVRAALEASDAAIALRPDVAGFRHTRGIALRELGRTDEAIRELDALWSQLASDERPLLEAERCYDLALAWRAKGEHEYAADYFDRARLAAPESEWARLAASEIDDHRGVAKLARMIES